MPPTVCPGAAAPRGGTHYGAETRARSVVDSTTCFYCSGMAAGSGHARHYSRSAVGGTSCVSRAVARWLYFAPVLRSPKAWTCSNTASEGECLLGKMVYEVEAEPEGHWRSLQCAQAPAVISQVSDRSQAAETIREAIAWIEGIGPGSFEARAHRERRRRQLAVAVCPL